MKRILVVDDNETNLYLIHFIMNKMGCEIIEARDGYEGVNKALQEKPDLIIMDIQLPGIDGHEATRRIRASDEGKDVPIIALTSFAMPADKELALAAGCTGYIPKPINVQSFMKEMNRYLKEIPDNEGENSDSETKRERVVKKNMGE